jgi:hypothetical protein
MILSIDEMSYEQLSFFIASYKHNKEIWFEYINNNESRSASTELIQKVFRNLDEMDYETLLKIDQLLVKGKLWALYKYIEAESSREKSRQTRSLSVSPKWEAMTAEINTLTKDVDLVRTEESFRSGSRTAPPPDETRTRRT